METIMSLLVGLFCLAAPVGLLIALGVWIGRQGSSAAKPAPVQVVPSRHMLLADLDALLERWAADGRLDGAVAAQVRALVAQERQALDLAQAVAAGTAAPPVMQPVVAATVPARADAAPPMAPAPAAPSPVVPAPAAPRQPRGERVWAALLSLRARQTLLFLGAFLLVVSALILIVFNWASFPPILQFALLAGVCGGFWAGGAWMARHAGLEQAGAGLQAVGGALVPVVAFSLSRPGLLDLAPRGAWLLASALSLPVYALAAWRLRHKLFVVAGCLSAASAVLAALGAVEDRWLPLALLVTLTAYLPLSRWLRGAAPDLAAGPWWVAHIGAPLALVVALMIGVSSTTRPLALAATLWAGAGFYLLAAWLEDRATASWAAVALSVAALPTSLAALNAGQPWWGIAPALLALGYLAVALAFGPARRGHALPTVAGAAVLTLLALAPTIDSPATARWTLPLLLVGTAALPLAHARGRPAWLPEANRLSAGTLGLLGAAILLLAWGLNLLRLTPLGDSARWMALLPLAALYILAARGWTGRMHLPHDRALQAVGVGFAALAGMTIMRTPGLWVAGMAALTVFWLIQTLLRRHTLWAAATLGNALLLGIVTIVRLDTRFTPDYWIALALGFAAAYLVGGTLARRTAWSFATWPALGWGALAGWSVLLAVFVGIDDARMVLTQHVGAVLALAGIVALVAALWRQSWPGYLVALLLALAALLAATRGFFTPWQPVPGDYGYVLCGLTLGLALLGQALRRIAPRYAHPYEVVGFALLTLAPLPASDDRAHATITWLAMALLYGLACWRYRLRWAAAPAYLAADMALLNGSAWLSRGGRAEGAALLLLTAAWAQALIGLWVTHRRPRPASGGLLDAEPAYVVALLSGLGALALGRGASDVLAIVALGLAALLALVSTVHAREEGAWSALALLALGLASLHDFYGIGTLWSMAWGGSEALAVCLIGWVIELSIKNTESRNNQTGKNIFSILNSQFSIWSRPLALGPLLAALALCGALLIAAPARDQLPPLTFALATLGLLLATLAVRRREAVYAYGAGAALVAAALCQIYDWGFRQPQWYAIPAGLYLLALAEGLRRFQGQRRLSQLIETGATAVLLGVTLGQSLSANGLTSQAYAAWLCVEALLLLGYGVLRQLRVPFLGGAAFFVTGVLWLSVDPLMAANKWVLIGALGLLLIGAYVLLERRQEQLVRAGRALVERVGAWD